MIFKNSKVYDVLKYISLIVLDAVGVAYNELSEVWGLPYGIQIMKTCTIISVLIGALIGISNYRYNKTELNDEYDQEEENSLEIETNEIDDTEEVEKPEIVEIKEGEE